MKDGNRDNTWGLGRRVLVTGGAGFVASELVPDLVRTGHMVTIFDNFATSEPDWRDALRGRLPAGGWEEAVRVEVGDVRELGRVEIACRGQDAVVHLASTTDIAGGADDPRVDFEGSLVGTWNVLEAMRRAGVGRVLYASSGVIYGDAVPRPSAENAGPLRPQSHYAAAKLAGEALISAFAHLHNWRATVFRFGNAVGPRTNHGVVHDLVVKVLRDPERLELLGDGTQAKPFIAVDDLVAGMRIAASAATLASLRTYNVATDGPVSIREVARIVADTLSVHPVVIQRHAPGHDGGWPGDTTLVDLDAGELRRLGWRPALDGRGAVAWAARSIAARYCRSGAPLVTGLERRRGADTTRRAVDRVAIAYPSAGRL